MSCHSFPILKIIVSVEKLAQHTTVLCSTEVGALNIRVSAMKIIITCFVGLSIFTSAIQVNAELVIEGGPIFTSKMERHLIEAKTKSHYLYLLISAVERSQKRIFIKPITDDKSTWHYSGKKSRSHTEALDNKKRGSERNTPTDAVIFINQNRITQTHKTYNSGTLIHELVHALDLASGNYHKDYKVRERRAIFFQNIWRSLHGKSLRTNYHDRFATLDYQNAKRDNQLENFIQYYFRHNALP